MNLSGTHLGQRAVILAGRRHAITDYGAGSTPAQAGTNADHSAPLATGGAQGAGGNPTWIGAQSRFVAVYVTPFWRQACLSGQAFSRVGPMVEVHDASATADAGYAPFGFVGVPVSMPRQHSPDALKSTCLAQLTAIVGSAASQALDSSAYMKQLHC